MAPNRRRERENQEDHKKRTEENCRLHRSWAPDLLNNEPNLPLTNPPGPTPEERAKTQERQQDLVTNYYPSSPKYVASYEEEDALTIVNNLIPKPTPKEKKDTNKMEESKTAEDRRDLIEIKDEEDKLESDWDSDYLY